MGKMLVGGAFEARRKDRAKKDIKAIEPEIGRREAAENGKSDG